MPTPYSWYLGHISETPTANAIWLLNKRWDPLFFSSCYCSVIKHNLHHIMCLTLCLNCSRTFKTMIWLFQSTSQNVFWFSSKLDIAFSELFHIYSKRKNSLPFSPECKFFCCSNRYYKDILHVFGFNINDI